jgi:hypothetical protein
MFGYIISTWSRTSITMDMAALIGKCEMNVPATSSGTVITYFIYSATTNWSWAFWHRKTVKMMYTHNNGHITLWLTMIQSQQLLLLCWCIFSRLGREHVTFSFSYKGGQYIMYICLQSIAPRITQHTRSTIVNSPLKPMFKIGQEGYHKLFFL